MYREESEDKGAQMRWWSCRSLLRLTFVEIRFFGLWLSNFEEMKILQKPGTFCLGKMIIYAEHTLFARNGISVVSGNKLESLINQ